MCVAIVTADTPHLRKLLLRNCFTATSMTKMHFKQNTTEKLDFRVLVLQHCIVISARVVKILMGDNTTFHADVRRNDHCTYKEMVYAKMFCGGWCCPG